jgi:hypothetical protein
LSVDRPDERHAVGDDQVEARHGFAEGAVVAGEGGDVGVGGFDGIGSVGFRRVIEDPFDGTGVGGGGDGRPMTGGCAWWFGCACGARWGCN